MNRYFRLLLVSIFVASSFLTVSSPSHTQAATTIHVATAAELIQAINDANSEAGVYVGADTIILDADITLIAIEASSSNIGGGRAGLPNIVTDITIQAGAGSTIERGYMTCDSTDSDPDFRIFNIRSGGTLGLDGVTVQNGCIAPYRYNAYGGGIYNDLGASLSLANAVVVHNTARGGDYDNGYGRGGGVFNNGTITQITHSMIAYNTAQGGGVGTNPRGAGVGGGVCNYDNGTITQITNSTIAHNTAQGGDVENSTFPGGYASGGGVYNDGSITYITNTTIAYNTAQGGNSFNGNGGGSAGGGGVRNAGPIMNITNSAIVHNTARGGDDLGSIYASGGGPGYGGGVYNIRGPITQITNSTIAYNIAQGGDDLASDYFNDSGGDSRGGGVYNRGFITQITNSTIAHNIAQGGDNLGSGHDTDHGGEAWGGGISTYKTLGVIANCTIAANHARGGTSTNSNGNAYGGGLYSLYSIDVGYETNIFSSVLADNDSTPGGGATAPNDCEMSPEAEIFVSDGYNLVEAPENCPFASTGDQTGIDPALGALADNGCTVTLPGGACVETMAITPASPAYDQGSCGLSGITEDERGADYTRPQDDPAVANADDGCDSGAFEVPVVIEVDLDVSKTESIDPVVAGSGPGNLTYVVTVTNTDVDYGATGVELDEALTLPAGVTVDSVTPSAGTFADPVWTVGTLGPGGSETLTVVLTVDNTAAAGTDVIDDTATITALDQVDPNPANDSATEATSISVPAVDLAVSKTESIDPVVAGSGAGNLTYVVTVTNTDVDYEATGVELDEVLTLPAGVTVDSVTPSAGTFADPVWTVGTLGPGGSETLTVVLTVDDTAAAGTDVIGDTATITALDQTDPNAANDSATEATSITVPVGVDLAVTMTESVDPVVAGSGPGNLTYVVTVTNTSATDTATNAEPSEVPTLPVEVMVDSADVTVSTNVATGAAPDEIPTLPAEVTADSSAHNVSAVPGTGVELGEVLTLPAGVTVDSVTPSAGTVTGSAPAYTWTVGTLVTATSETLTIVLTVDGAAAAGTDVIISTATITAVDQPDPDPDNDSATEATSIIVPGEVDLAVTKNESVDPVEAGSGAGNLTYVVAVRNTSATETATGVELDEVLTLPAGVTVDSVTPSVGTFVDPVWTVGTLTPGARETLVVVLTVDGTAAEGTDVISDTAMIAALDQPDPNPANDTATEATSIVVPEEPEEPEEPKEPETPVVPVKSDPSLSKIGVLQPGGLGVPGEQITWMITLWAPAGAALTNVTVTDTFPPELRVDGVTTTTGTATISGQTVLVTIPYLDAGASAEIRVTTTVLSYPGAPYLENTAVATADGGVSLTATARVPVVQSLPETGYPPGD